MRPASGLPTVPPVGEAGREQEDRAGRRRRRRSRCRARSGRFAARRAFLRSRSTGRATRITSQAGIATIRSVRNAARREQRELGRRQAATVRRSTRQHRADEHHRAEHVQEERQERAAVGDHGPASRSCRQQERASRARRARTWRCRAGRGGLRAARRQTCPLPPRAAPRRPRVVSWCFPPAPPSALAITQRTIAAQIQKRRAE